MGVEVVVIRLRLNRLSHEVRIWSPAIPLLTRVPRGAKRSYVTRRYASQQMSAIRSCRLIKRRHLLNPGRCCVCRSSLVRTTCARSLHACRWIVCAQRDMGRLHLCLVVRAACWRVATRT